MRAENSFILIPGIIDFIISSGLMTLIAAIPVPDLAVPYAAPRAVKIEDYCNEISFFWGRMTMQLENFAVIFIHFLFSEGFLCKF